MCAYTREQRIALDYLCLHHKLLVDRAAPQRQDFFSRIPKVAGITARHPHDRLQRGQLRAIELERLEGDRVGIAIKLERVLRGKQQIANHKSIHWGKKERKKKEKEEEKSLGLSSSPSNLLIAVLVHHRQSALDSRLLSQLKLELD